MSIESVFPYALIIATLFCTLVTGFVLIFAIVVMPGIRKLPDREFLRAFQVIDRVIQKNQPIFILIWVGSVAALVLSTVLGFLQFSEHERWPLVFATTIYLVGAQLPTMMINVPLNNRVQKLDIDTLDQAKLAAERNHFEPRWNRWNAIRTVFAAAVSLLLATLLVP